MWPHFVKIWLRHLFFIISETTQSSPTAEGVSASTTVAARNTEGTTTAAAADAASAASDSTTSTPNPNPVNSTEPVSVTTGMGC